MEVMEARTFLGSRFGVLGGKAAWYGKAQTFISMPVLAFSEE
jgi:hypothetical protein